MAAAGRYVSNEHAFKEDAFAVLQSKFSDRLAFEEFYESLSTSKRKNEFLRICSSYRYLAKEGDWKISVPGHDEIIEYLTNSYKLVAVFSLIESLSQLRHQDFYEWLSAKESSDVYPIQSKADFNKHYSDYKASFGAIRKCVAFFERLDPMQQARLCDAIYQNVKPIANIKKLAEYLYLLRSKFVHKAELVLKIGTSPIYGSGSKGVDRSSLSVKEIFDAFENGVLAYFCNERSCGD